MSTERTYRNSYATEVDETTIVVVHESQLFRDCIARAIATELPSHRAVGIPSIDEIDRVGKLNASLIIVFSVNRRHDDTRLIAEMQAAKAAFPDAPIALISDGEEEPMTFRAISWGLRGFISSADTLEVAVAAMRLILAGRSYYEQRTGLMVNHQIRSQASETDHRPERDDDGIELYPEAHTPLAPGSRNACSTLTAREAEVLVWLQRGSPNKTIANRLMLSENTVKVHVRRIMRKLNARNRTEAVLLSHRN